MFGHTKKLHDIEEQRREIRISKMNYELLEHLTSTVGYLLHQNEKHGLQIPNKEQIQDSVRKAQSLLSSMSDLASFDPHQPKGNTDNLPTRKQNLCQGTVTLQVDFC